MRKIILSLLVLSGTFAYARERKQVSYMTTVGMGICMNTPVSIPFTWQVSGHYNFGGHFSSGIGTGVSFYEKNLVPLFADVRYRLGRSRKFVPFVGCSAGYGFALSGKSNGGIYVNPSVGVQYSVHRRMMLFVSLGYELQRFERLKSYKNSILSAEFAEHLSHQLISVKVGIELR